MTRRGCGCCGDGDGLGGGYCCNQLGPRFTNFVTSLKLGSEDANGNWSLVELVAEPIEHQPLGNNGSAAHWRGDMQTGAYIQPNFPCYTRNFYTCFIPGSGFTWCQLPGAWNTTRFGDYVALQSRQRYQMTQQSQFLYTWPTVSDFSSHFDTTIECNVPARSYFTSPVGPLLFKINTVGGAGTIAGTPPSGWPSLLSQTTFDVKLNDPLYLTGQPWGTITFAYPHIVSNCWPIGANCNWANATFTSGQWVKVGQPTQTQSGASSFQYDVANGVWYLSIPYTSSAGNGNWIFKPYSPASFQLIELYTSLNSPMVDLFKLPTTCNGFITMNGSTGSNSQLSFQVSNSSPCGNCSDG